MATMSNENDPPALVAEQPQKEDADLTSTEVVVYEEPSLELTEFDTTPDVAKAYTDIDGNLATVTDLLAEAILGGGSFTGDEIKEMLDLIRSQSVEFFELAMDAKEHTDNVIHDIQQRARQYMQQQAMYIASREQQLGQTITVQHSTIHNLQQQFSQVVLQNGLLRGENCGLNNHNYVLRERLTNVESFATNLQNQMQLMQKNHCEEYEKTKSSNAALKNEMKVLQEQLRKASSTDSNANLQGQKHLLQEQHKRELDDLHEKLNKEKKAFELAKKDFAGHKKNFEGARKEYRQRLATAAKTISDIKQRNENLKNDAEQAVEAATKNFDKTCLALEDAKKLRIENKALKDKMKENESNGTELVMSKLREKDALRKHNALNDRSQELKKTLEAKCDEAKKREMEAMAKRDVTLARLEKLQMQMQMQQKAYEELNVKYNDVQKDSEYFALLAQESSVRELEALAELRRLSPNTDGEDK
ncbi:DNA double-strand break repair Rad50 ATPase [Lasiodiplodia theobromae]|uniref:DNA double-strand break repair Rad50 ATPase n=1 Tax=Lasiodiplodia theobromae TaxID=45133 RepID=A0A5N5DLZ5_9PEZI|nr:DNA double-strand break repair Rad50 ATPase [Lasiodiplodia theobromae]